MKEAEKISIESKIHIIRHQRVMLDRDLAELYGVKTGVLNQSVKRNIERFPDDFMFSLTREEIMNLSQIVTSSKIKHAPRSVGTGAWILDFFKKEVASFGLRVSS